MALNRHSRPLWWELASAGTITCGSLTVLSLWVQGEAASALPIYGGGGAVNVEGVAAGANAAIRVTADRGLVRWQEFSVQAGERFRIEGRPTQAILNVVTGPEVSRIAGVVDSGPRFLLANPNGIEVLGTGQIVAPSTWLTTGSVRDDEWVRHRPAMSGSDLSTPHVQLDRQTAINLVGLIDADAGGHGGDVTLLAHEINLASSAHIVASGAKGGGTIHLGGSAQGLGPGPTASRVSAAAGARLEASATETGPGGEVIVWSEQDTRFAGQIEALGGPDGGDGGFVEVSGRQQLDFQGLVSTLAPRGNAGTLLLDPTNLTINDSADRDIAQSTGTVAPSGTPSVLSWSTIQNNLKSSSLLIQTTSSPTSGTEKGSITIATASPDLNLANRTLTFQAADDIRIDANISSTATSGALVFKAGTSGSNNSVTIANGKQVEANRVTMTADAVVFGGGSVDQVITQGAQGEQRYNGSVRLTGDTLLSGKQITFAGDVDGSYALEITTQPGGAVTFEGPVGSSTPLTSMAIQSDAITINGGAVSTTANQTYAEQLYLGADTTLKSTGQGALIRLSQVDSAPAIANASLTIESLQGDVRVLGSVGGISALGAIEVKAGGLTEFGDPVSGVTQFITATSLSTDSLGSLAFHLQGGEISTTGSQSYEDTDGVLISSDMAFRTTGGIASSLTVAGAIEAGDPADFGPPNLLIDVAGTVAFKGAVGSKNPLGVLTVANSYGTRFESVLRANSFVFQPTGVLPSDAGSNGLEFLGDLELAGCDPALPCLQFDYPDDTVRLRDLALMGARTRIQGSTVVMNNTGLLTIGGLFDAQGDPINSLTIFEGGLSVTGSQQKTSLAGVIQAGINADFSVALRGASSGGKGLYQLVAHQSPGNTVTFKAGSVNLSGTVDSADGQSVNLVIDSQGFAENGGTRIGAVVGGVRPLESLTTTNGRGYLTLATSSIITQQGQHYAEARTRVDVKSLTARSLNADVIEFAGTVDGPLNGSSVDLRLITDGIVRFGGAIGSLTPLANLSTAGFTSAAGTTELNGGLARTLGDQIYDQAVTLGSDLVLRSDASGTIRFARALDGAGGLSIEAAGAIDFQEAIGATTPLNSLTIQPATGTTTLRAGSITTEGLQSFAGSTLLGSTTTLTSTKGGGISLGGTINAETAGDEGLTVNTAGPTTLAGSIGATVPISSLSTDAPGTLALAATTISSTGAQVYREALITVGNGSGDLTILESTSGGDLRLGLQASDRLDGPGALQLRSLGDATIAGVAGSTTPLQSLRITARTIDLQGVTTVQAQDFIARDGITTSGTHATLAAGQPVSFNGSLVLADHTTVITSGGVVSFLGDVDSAALSARDLAVISTGQAGGDIRLLGVVGGARALGDVSLVGSGVNQIRDLVQSLSLVAETTGTTQLAGGSLITTNGQDYRSPVELLADTVLSSTAGGTIAFRDSLISPINPFDLAIRTSGATIFDGAVGEDSASIASSLRSLTTTSSGTVEFNGGLVRTIDSQSYGQRVILGADLLLRSDQGGDITLPGMVEAVNSVASALEISTAGMTVIGGPVGSLATPITRIATDQSGTLRLNGGSVITLDDQIYGELLGLDLGVDTVLTATSPAASIWFGGPVNGTVSGQQALTIDNQGLIRFFGSVGERTALERLVIDGAAPDRNTVEIHGESVTTAGGQTFGGDLVIRAANPENTRFLAGGPIVFGGSVDLDPASQPGHLTVEAPGASVSFDGDVGAQSPFQTVTVLTGDLNLGNATIHVNGWDSINPNRVQSVPTLATIALQGSRSINSERPGGIQGGTVLQLQNPSPNNSRWMVWSYAPLANKGPTPVQSLQNQYGVQYLTSYNQGMKSALSDASGNQFLYEVADTPRADVVAFDYQLNALQPPLELRVPEPESLLETLPNYIRLSPDRLPFSWSSADSPRDDFSDALAFLSPTSQGPSVDGVPDVPGGGLRPDAEPMVQLESTPAPPGDLSMRAVPRAGGSQASIQRSIATATPTADAAAVPAIRAADQGAAGSRAAVLPVGLAPAETTEQAYPLALSRRLGFPGSPLRLENLQISGYQFRSQAYVAMLRNERGFYTPPEGMRLRGLEETSAGSRAQGPVRGPELLELVVEQPIAPGGQSARGQTPVLERVTLAVPMVFGTVMHVDVPIGDRPLRSL